MFYHERLGGISQALNSTESIFLFQVAPVGIKPLIYIRHIGNVVSGHVQQQQSLFHLILTFY